ncbi:MAG TPA: hypothetical protein VN802_18430 [Stellaceae bacterium]|nr:hypothetical protein [Stellaceae bacterium]
MTIEPRYILSGFAVGALVGMVGTRLLLRHKSGGRRYPRPQLSGQFERAHHLPLAPIAQGEARRRVAETPFGFHNSGPQDSSRRGEEIPC